MPHRPVVAAVVAQHAELATDLYQHRNVWLRAPNVKIHHLLRLDERLLAHLDGLAVAAHAATAMLEPALAGLHPGAVFALATDAIERPSVDAWSRLFALARESEECRRALIAAFGWQEPERLQGIIVKALGASDPTVRSVAIAACAVHGVDPMVASILRSRNEDAVVRARALRAVGELGLQSLVSACGAAIEEDDPERRYWAAWSAVLVGDRNRGIDELLHGVAAQGARRWRGFALALQAMPTGAAHRALQRLEGDSGRRWRIQGSGIIGDPQYVPWLVSQMRSDPVARCAGEAFSLITGVDLAARDLERKPPDDFESGPSDDPEDAAVEMDPDEGLPWPDADRVARWWTENSSRFVPGERYFMGAPVAREHCIDVLKTGYQRQRILAAHHLCLLDPGTPLFNTSAPAWRQQKLLAQMT